MQRLRKLLVLPLLGAAFAVAAPGTAAADDCLSLSCPDSMSINVDDGKLVIVSTYGPITCVETFGNGGHTTRCGPT